MTQLQLLKRAFDRGERLTVLSAVTRYGIYALSQRCGQLINDGYPVAKRWHSTTSDKRIRLYSKGRK